MDTISTMLELEKRASKFNEAKNLNSIEQKVVKLSKKMQISKFSSLNNNELVKNTQDSHCRQMEMFSQHYSNSTNGNEITGANKPKLFTKKSVKNFNSKDSKLKDSGRKNSKLNPSSGNKLSHKIEDFNNRRGVASRNRVYLRKNIAGIKAEMAVQPFSVKGKGRVHTLSPERSSQKTKDSSYDKNDALDSLRRN